MPLNHIWNTNSFIRNTTSIYTPVFCFIHRRSHHLSLHSHIHLFGCNPAQKHFILCLWACFVVRRNMIPDWCVPLWAVAITLHQSLHVPRCLLSGGCTVYQDNLVLDIINISYVRILYVHWMMTFFLILKAYMYLVCFNCSTFNVRSMGRGKVLSRVSALGMSDIKW